jgi:hypothetical protein
MTGKHSSAQVNEAAGRIGAGLLPHLLKEAGWDGATRALAGAAAAKQAAANRSAQR